MNTRKINLSLANLRILKYLYVVFLMTSIHVKADAVACNETKEIKLEEYRVYFSKHGYRSHDLRKYKGSLDDAQKALQDNGLFSDQSNEIGLMIEKKWALSPSVNIQQQISDEIESAYRRYWIIAETYRGKDQKTFINDKPFRRLLEGVVKVGKIELERGDITSGRFHASCFAIPTAAINMYFCLFELMEEVEVGNLTDPLILEANRVLKEVGMQSWTQPFRNDETDKNVIQVDRFRNHVWWVGGNGIAYRSVLPAAVMMRSVEMMDVLAEVAKGAISSVSQNTYNEAFWTEGFTADGAGWGHGKQCLIWGYPIDGTGAALSLLGFFKDSPWQGELNKDNVKALMNFFRGSSWYYHNAYIPPCLGRGSMAYFNNEKKDIPSEKLLKNVFKDWIDCFSIDEQEELKLLAQSIENQKMTMPGSPSGYYTGTRWFFNNDDLIKKSNDYYMLVNMASIRCDGIESAYTIADGYNFYTCDGMTLYQKTGDEYLKAIGGWNLTAIPGVTSRQGEDQLSPIINWRGFCSKYNYAVAATSGSHNAVAGFVFEKMNASAKKNVNDKVGLDDSNSLLYEVNAHKFYFTFDDIMLALGAGVNNLNTKIKGDIWTTLDQTIWQGDVTYGRGNEKPIKQDQHCSEMVLKKSHSKQKHPIWISNGSGFSYAILTDQTPGEVCFSLEKRQTKWEKLNASNKNKSNLPSTQDIFQLWINHSQMAIDDTYGYLVYGGKEEANKVFSSNPVKVISNTTSLQAASNLEETVIGAVFYKANGLMTSEQLRMSVSNPCAVLLEIENDKCKLTVTDPEMNKDLNQITIKTTLHLGGDDIQSESGWNIITFDMPQGKECGKPVTKELMIKKP